MMQSLFLRRYSLLLLVLILGTYSSPVVGQSSRDYTVIDLHAAKTPKKATKNLEKLTKHLCKRAQDDYEKVRAIYTWISQNIQYDQGVLTDDNYFYNFNSTKVLNKRRAVCTGFARILGDMCTLAGIQSQVINGYSKQTLTARENLDKPDHAWNAVLIDNSWYLIDVTWAQGLSTAENQNNNYFLSSPYYFIKTHLPSIKMWQLLEYPISIDQFKTDDFIISDQSDTIGQYYNYTDTINQFLSLSPANQRLYRDQEIYKFNPTSENADIAAHAIVDYASVIIENLEKEQSQDQTDSLHHGYQKAVNLLSKAYNMTEFYPWQIDLYGSALINLSIGLHQSEVPQGLTEQEYFTSIIEHLDRVVEINDVENQNDFQKYQTTQALKYKEEFKSVNSSKSE